MPRLAAVQTGRRRLRAFAGAELDIDLPLRRNEFKTLLQLVRILVAQETGRVVVRDKDDEDTAFVHDGRNRLQIALDLPALGGGRQRGKVDLLCPFPRLL